MLEAFSLAIQLAIFSAKPEVDDKACGEPKAKEHPIFHRDFCHQVKTTQQAKHRNQ